MGSIDQHNAAALARVHAHAREVAARHEAIDERNKDRIVTLLSVAGCPMKADRLIDADRALHGRLGGYDIRTIERYCAELYSEERIDMKQTEDGLIVFRVNPEEGSHG